MTWLFACAAALDATTPGVEILEPDCIEGVAAHTEHAGYASVQAAIDDGDPDDLIHVCAGEWEGRVRITRNVSLLGISPQETVLVGGLDVTDARANLTDLWVARGVQTDDLVNNGAYGGGIRALNARLQLSNVAITDNTAIHGAGISASESSVELTDGCVVARNAAVVGGGILLESSSLSLSIDSGVTENVAEGLGGGIFALDSHLSGGTIVQNKATYGGGVVLSRATLEDVQVTANNAESGAGVYGSDFLLRGTDLSGNTATLDGGAIYSYGGTVGVFDSTVQRNVATRGAGAWLDTGTLASVETAWTDQHPDDIAATDLSWNAGDKTTFNCTAFACD